MTSNTDASSIQELAKALLGSDQPDSLMSLAVAGISTEDMAMA
jgi:hypothetical protein